jgi:hypothetical protein
MALQIIDALPYLGKDKQQELARYLLEKFRFSVTARSQQIESKYKKWMDNYSGKPLEEVRTTPWYRASNFVPQLIRMHTDIMTARMTGIIFGTKPFWKLSSVLDAVPRQILEIFGSWLEFETSGQRMNFYPAIRSGIYRGFKTGTNVYKTCWIDAPTHGYKVVSSAGTELAGYLPTQGAPTRPQGKAQGIQSRVISKEGMKLYPVPFEDFFPFPITCEDMEQLQIKFHRLRFTKEQVELRKTKGLWAAGPAQLMLDTNGDYKQDQARRSQAEEAGITLTKDVVMPFTAIEAWLSYPMLDGFNYKLCAVFNPFVDEAEQGLLRLYFNPDSRGEEPFVVQRPQPREDFFYGYSFPEMLEQSQEEQAQIHNSRRDSNTIVNIPGWKKKRLADVPNPASEWYPGKVFEVENMDDLEPIQFGGSYNSMIEEENFLLGLVNQYTGIGSALQASGNGITDGKRGVYSAQGTMAMLQAGNDRPDMYLKEYRECFHQIGKLVYRANKNWRTTPLPFQLWGANGAVLAQVFQFPEPPDYDPIYFSIGASDGSANKEVDRTNLLLMANTMAGYYNQLFQAISVVGTLPPGDPRREILLLVLDGAKDLADRLLFVFDIGDRKKLIPDVRDILGGGGAPMGGGAQPPEQAGMPGAQGAVSLSGIQALSQGIAALPR